MFHELAGDADQPTITRHSDRRFADKVRQGPCKTSTAVTAVSLGGQFPRIACSRDSSESMTSAAMAVLEGQPVT